MKILFVMSRLDRNGPPRILTELILNSEKISSCVISLKSPNPELVETFLNRNIEVVDMSKDSSARKMISKVGSFLPEVIVTLGTKADLAIYNAQKLISRKIPIITSIHSTLSNDSLQNLGIISGLVQKIIYKRILNRFSRVITVSKESKEDLIKNFGVEESKVAVIYNGLNTGSKYIERKPPKGRPWRVVVCGRLVKRKRIDIAMKTISLVRSLGHQVELIVIGDGPEKTRLVALAKALNIDKFVKWYGWVTNTTEFMNDGDIYLLTSKAEGLPVTLLEAMSIGIPSVVSGVGAIPEVLFDDELSIVNDMHEINFANKIIKIIHDDNYSKLSQNVYYLFKQRFSITRMVGDYEKLFEYEIKSQ